MSTVDNTTVDEVETPVEAEVEQFKEIFMSAGLAEVHDFGITNAAKVVLLAWDDWSVVDDSHDISIDPHALTAEPDRIEVADQDGPNPKSTWFHDENASSLFSNHYLLNVEEFFDAKLRSEKMQIKIHPEKQNYPAGFTTEESDVTLYVAERIPNEELR